MAFGVDLEDPTGLGSVVSGLKSVQSGLFPDPSKIASAGYYGAKQRESMLTAAKTADQMNSQLRLQGALPGSGVPGVAGRYVPLQGVGLNAPMVWQSDQQVVPTQPINSPLAMAVSPGGPLAPQRMADVVTAPGSMTQTGQAPPASVPSPSAMTPAPNTTGSDGSVPANDPRLIHPASVTPGDGGQKQSGPAGPNGSPAPTAINLAPLIAMAAASGMDAAQATGLMTGYIADLYRNGRIDKNTRDELNAQLVPGKIYGETAATTRTGMEQQGATTRTGMTEAGALRRHEITNAENQRQFNQSLETTVAPDTGQPTFIRREAVQPGTPKYDPPIQLEKTQQAGRIQTAGRELTWFQDDDGSYRQGPREEVVRSGKRIVDAEAARRQLTEIQVQSPDGKGTRMVPLWRVQQEGLQPTPTGMDQLKAITAQQSGAPGVSRLEPSKGTTAEENIRNQIARQKVADSYYPPDTGVFTRSGIKGVKFDGPATAAIDELAAQYKADSGDPTTYQDDAASHAKAIRTLQAEGKLTRDVTRPEIWNRLVNNLVTDAAGNKYVQLGLTSSLADTVSGPATTTAPTAPTTPPAPTSTTRRRTPSTAAVPPAPAPKPTRDLGAAVTGMIEGQVYEKNGVTVRVTNGRLVPE